MDRDDHYSHADRDALPRLVDRLLAHCDCRAGWPARRGLSGGTRRIAVGGGSTYCAFEPGSRVVLDPYGDASYSAGNAVGADGRCVLCRPVFWPQQACVDIEPRGAQSTHMSAPECPVPVPYGPN